MKRKIVVCGMLFVFALGFLFLGLPSGVFAAADDPVTFEGRQADSISDRPGPPMTWAEYRSKLDELATLKEDGKITSQEYLNETTILSNQYQKVQVGPESQIARKPAKPETRAMGIDSGAIEPITPAEEDHHH